MNRRSLRIVAAAFGVAASVAVSCNLPLNTGHQVTASPSSNQTLVQGVGNWP